MCQKILNSTSAKRDLICAKRDLICAKRDLICATGLQVLDCQVMAKTYPGRSHQCQKRKDSEVLLMMLLM